MFQESRDAEAAAVDDVCDVTTTSGAEIPDAVPCESAAAVTHDCSPVDTPAEWRRRLAGFTLGALLFETITGLTIYFLPFSVFNQYAVLLHTVVGLLTIMPVTYYIGQHWWRRYRGNLTHYQLLGYVSAAALTVLVVSGFVLTYQALFEVRISRTWDLVHVVTTFTLIAGLGAHLVTLLVRRVRGELGGQLRAARVACLRRSLVWGGVPLVACGLLAVIHRPPAFNDGFPVDYSFKYGSDRPYAPSLARKDMTRTEGWMKARILDILTEEQDAAFLAGSHPDPMKHVGPVAVAENVCATMSLSEGQRAAVAEALAEARADFREHGALDPRRLAGSESCGRIGCHSEIAKEWGPSAHRYASMDFVFQKVQENFAQEVAPEAVRYCAGCHDPIAMFAGAKNVGNETLSVEGADEGVSCLACHSMVQADVRGNADYTIAPTSRYLYEFAEGPAAQIVSDFLIRAYPQEHIVSYSRPLYKTAEACGACHKQFVDEEINNFGWVQGQNQYDSWRKSRWHKENDPVGTISCRECHMPLVDSDDPASGDKDDSYRRPQDGKHRSHRFLGANQFVPRYHHLPGAEEHCELTVQWLRGEYPVPEIADRWRSGPVAKISVVVPETVRPGEEVSVQTIVTNNKAGHDFPTGPLDMIEGWVEVTVRDSTGGIVFTSSRADERGYLINPEIVFKAELINKLGALIGKHELWTLVGARYKRSLFPGVTDTTTFDFTCPGMPGTAGGTPIEPEQTHTFGIPPGAVGEELRVSAVVWYCKFSAPFLDRLFGAEARQRSEVTDLARAEAIIKVVHDTETDNEPSAESAAAVDHADLRRHGGADSGGGARQ